ncbi:hypothetical protein JOF41_002290 [Saccharothrix coeruleofusca]|nr:hypothetical protein [Saccharothrix coeruleofusca]MBP2336112.1 hypothetical protein [Saccharothrix coeruleofusca]
MGAIIATGPGDVDLWVREVIALLEADRAAEAATPLRRSSTPCREA